MNKLFLFVFSWMAIVSANLWANGPWLIYSTKEAGTERSLLLLNLEHPQYSFTETEADNDTWIHYNPKTKTVFRKIYYDNDNEIHRLSWGRNGRTFYLAYSQYNPLNSDNVGDHGVLLGTGSVVSWPNKGKSLGVSGQFPISLKFTLLRIDAGWTGDYLTTGSRRGSFFANWVGTLEVALTKALNDARTGLTTNQDAKEFIIDYFTNPARGYTQTADVEE